MSLPYASTTSETGADLYSAADARLQGRQLLVARIVWGLLVVLALGIFILAMPTRYFQLSMPSEEIREVLAQVGFSGHFYALYYLAIGGVFSLGCFVIATVIAWRKPNDGTALFVSLFLILYGAVYGPNSAAVEQLHPALVFPARFSFFLLLSFQILFFFLFPNGRFVPRWTWSLVLVWTAWFAFAMFAPSQPLADGPDVSGALLVLAGYGSGIAAQIYRYRRVANATQRQQTKWVVFGITAAALGFIAFIVLPGVLFPSLAEPSPRTLLFHMAAEAAAMFTHLLIPLSIGFAILRYRLWDIDLIINRTLVYGALTASIVGIYVLVVGGVSALLQTRGNLLISLLATGVVAVLFAPLRDRLQRGINRLMYGERDDPYGVLSRLGQRLEATLAPDAVLPAIVETVKGALKLPYVVIAMKTDQRPMTGDESSSADGIFETVAAAGSPTSGEVLRLPLVYQSETIGLLLLAPRSPGEPFSIADRRLLANIAHQAGIALHAIRLHTHAIQLAADLQRSREHLVTAREEERRRLRRDLHDGLGPQLASLTLKLETARNRLAHVPDTDAMFSDLIERTQAAVADIRRLVYALRPPVLDEFGLVSALREGAAQYARHGQYSVSILIEAPERLPPLPAAVEVAAYRIVQEALTNVVRHAQARTCVVRLWLDEAAGTLCLEVQDDGWGLPTARGTGVGLQSMRERAEELGGTFSIETIPTGGTIVRAYLPLLQGN